MKAQQQRSRGWALFWLIVASIGLASAMTGPPLFPSWLETLIAAGQGALIADSIDTLAGDA